MNRGWRTQEAEEETSWPVTLSRLFQNRKRVFGNLVDVLTDCGQLWLNPLQFLEERLAVEISFHESELFLIELRFEWTATGHDYNFIWLFRRIDEQPMSEINGT